MRSLARTPPHLSFRPYPLLRPSKAHPQPPSIRSYLGPITAAPDLQGTVRGPTPYVQIRWVWLIFVCLELLLSTLFLAGTIIVTKRSRLQIMKSSSLATMCALDEPTRRRLGDIHDLDAVEKAARRTDVRLERAVSGMGMWLSGSR